MFPPGVGRAPALLRRGARLASSFLILLLPARLCLSLCVQGLHTRAGGGKGRERGRETPSLVVTCSGCLCRAEEGQADLRSAVAVAVVVVVQWARFAPSADLLPSPSPRTTLGPPALRQSMDRRPPRTDLWRSLTMRFCTLAVGAAGAAAAAPCRLEAGLQQRRAAAGRPGGGGLRIYRFLKASPVPFPCLRAEDSARRTCRERRLAG